MRVVTSVASMQRLAQRWKRLGLRTVFVPTMGYLHEGHLSLVRRARRLAGKRGQVIVSIYVNPTQFGPKEDLSRYPRDLKRDLALCKRAHANTVFVPPDAEMYPGKTSGRYSTFIVEETLSQPMEGAARPGHFRGVTTIVGKLFNIVQPEIAIFGAKDFQQAAVVRRMTENLNFPVRVVIEPIVRESDGLAMSSRNKYLNSSARTQAAILWNAIEAARSIVRKQKAIPAAKLKRQLQHAIHVQPAAEVDYIEFFDRETLLPVKTVRRGVQMALAVFIGKTRLIDNAVL